MTLDEEGLIAYGMLPIARNVALWNGYNVIVDTCGAHQYIREAALGIPDNVAHRLSELHLHLTRYAVELRVPKKDAIQRVAQRENISEGEAERRIDANIPEPFDMPGVTHLVYDNSTPEDLDGIKHDLRKRFEPFLTEEYRQGVKPKRIGELPPTPSPQTG